MFAFDLPVLLFVLGGAIGMSLAPDRAAAQPLFLAILGGGVLYFAGAVLGRFPRAAYVVLTSLVATGVLISIYFLTQAHRFSYADKIGLVTSLRSMTGSYLPAFGSWMPFPASLATALECVLFGALALAIGARAPLEKRIWFVATALLGLAIVATASRGAWAATALAMGVWLVRSPRPKMLAVPAAVFGAWALAPLARGELHSEALTLIGDSPFTGVGLAGFAWSLSKYVLLIQVPFLSYSHNLLFDAWLQQGLPGATAIVWITAAVIASIVAAPSRDRDRAGYLYNGCMFGVLAVLLHGTTDARPYVDPWCGVPLFLMLGMGRGMSENRTWAVSKAPMLAAIAFTVGVVVWSGSPVAAWLTGRGSLLQARDAESAFFQALHRDPAYAPAHFRLGLLLMEQEAFAAARTHLNAAFQAAPASPGRRKALGLASVWTGDPAYGAELLRQQPGIVDELNTWGTWREGRGQHDLAESAFRTSLLIMPGQEIIRNHLRNLSAGQLPIR